MIAIFFYVKRDQKKAVWEHRKTMAVHKNWTALRTKSQRRYYYNPTTGESSWKPPAAEAAVSGGVSGEECLPLGWSKGESDGTTFYYHDDGQSTSWKFPDWIPQGWTPPGSFEQMDGEMKSDEEVGDAQWVSAVSSAGQTYYFNEMTGESSWELVNLSIIEEDEEKEEGNNLVVEMESNPMSAAREIEMTSDSRIEKKRKMKGKRTRWSITGRV